MRWMLLVIAAVVVLLAAVPVANAAWPGADGKIVFTTVDDPHDRVWTVSPDGSDLHLIAEFGNYGRGIEVSPSGQLIALTEGGAHLDGLGVMTMEGVPVAQFGLFCGDFGTPCPVPEPPHWSPDGTRIVFVQGGVGVFTLATQTTMWLPDTASATDARWSANGAEVSYSIGAMIYESNADGSGSAHLIASPFPVSPGITPVSPNGQRRVFFGAATDESEQIFTSDLDGSNAFQVTHIVDDYCLSPSDCLDDGPFAGNFHPYEVVWQSIPDSTGPTCVLASKGVAANGHNDIVMMVGDTGAGLESIQVTNHHNALVDLPSFTPGDNATLTVRATRINQSKKGTLRLTLRDTVGNTTRCDPRF
jgi:hypothetical protein